jgi:transcriptional regulator with XRE-family HTH domain
MSNLREFSRRLAEERDRIDLKGAEMAAACGVNGNSQSEYENGKRWPKGDYLLRACELGVDGLYLLTGRRSLPISSDADDQAFDRLTVLWAELPEAIKISVVHLVETIAGQKGGRG